MRSFEDRTHISHKFVVGDLVFVKLRPHRQNLVEGRRVRKLSKRFYRLFKIIKALG